MNATHTKRDWTTTMAWSAQRRAAMKKAAALTGFLTQAGEAKHAHQGRVTPDELRTMEAVGELLQQAMTLIGCTRPLDQIENELAGELAWIEEHA